MTYENLLYEVRERVAHITLNRPEKTNALSLALRHELYAVLKEAERNQDVGSIVIKGAGKSFCAGYDISPETPSPNFPEDGYVAPDVDQLTGQYAQSLVDGYWIMWDLTKPVIAQVHGYCLAGGVSSLPCATLCSLQKTRRSVIRRQEALVIRTPSTFPGRCL